MRVIRVEAEGITASFRYPFFMVGRQPTFEMPPPATIYGHICSAAGRLLDPASLEFAYKFEHLGGVQEDLEHFHSTAIAPRSTFQWRGTKVSKNVETEMQPVRRAFLFQPRLTLYVTDLALAAAFRSPHYAVVLGRSQDLFTYTRVAEVDLVESDRAYVEGTLLPGGIGRWAGVDSVAIAMPRYIDYSRGRAVTFGQYQMVRARKELDNLSGMHGRALLIDPESEEHHGLRRAVVFHTFVDRADE